MEEDYTSQAQEFLKRHGITFKAVYKGDRCPPYCDDQKHIHGERYYITFTRKQPVIGKSRRLSLSFWNSLNDVEEGIAPTAYHVLACIEKNGYQDFADFCDALGYDTDSIKAHQTYKIVDREYQKVCSFFTTAEVLELQDIN